MNKNVLKSFLLVAGFCCVECFACENGENNDFTKENEEEIINNNFKKTRLNPWLELEFSISQNNQDFESSPAIEIAKNIPRPKTPFTCKPIFEINKFLEEKKCRK